MDGNVNAAKDEGDRVLARLLGLAALQVGWSDQERKAIQLFVEVRDLLHNSTAFENDARSTLVSAYRNVARAMIAVETGMDLGGSPPDAIACDNYIEALVSRDCDISKWAAQYTFLTRDCGRLFGTSQDAAVRYAYSFAALAVLTTLLIKEMEIGDVGHDLYSFLG